jgi:phage/plasmid primase-like uncharacterized protein
MNKFPLVLSCGHTTRKSIDDPGCSCDRVPAQYQANGDSPIDRALHRFQGRWRQVLESYGAQLPRGKNHGPCPICGGRDRFRFDDKKGLGTWYCGQCIPSSGGGLKLLSMYIGKSTMDTAKELVGDDDFRSSPIKRVHNVNHDEVRAANIAQAKIGAASLMATAVKSTHVYMKKKGFDGEYLVNGEPMYSSGNIIKPGDLMLIPAFKNGELVNVQKITNDGIKRPITGGDMQGVHHVIGGKDKNVAVAEGYATGESISKATGWKIYCGFNAGNLESAVKQAKQDHPNANIFVMADNDEIDPAHNRRPGEYFAEKAAAPFGAFVCVAPELGDWDDYRQKNGTDKLKETLRESVKAELSKAKPATAVASAPAIESAASIQAPTTTPAEKPAPTPAPAFGSWLTEPSPKQQKSAASKSLPDGVCLDDVDVDNPPGLAGDIVRYMKAGAHRKLEGGAFSAMAIQTMAMAGSSLRGFRHSKLSLITITLGVSASGKDRAQGVSKELLNYAGITVYGDIRSDKDVIRACAYDDGRCFYIKDEAHSLLGDSLGGKDKNTSKIPALLMEIATSSLYNLSKLHADEFEAQMTAKKMRLEKMILAKEDIKMGFNVDLEKAKIKHIEHEIRNLQVKVSEADRVLYAIEHGVRDPSLNLAALSTPQKLSSIIDEDSIESGFLGRALIFDCGVERVQNESLGDFNAWKDGGYASHDDKMLFERIKAEICMIAQMSQDVRSGSVESDFVGDDYRVLATDEATRMIYDISVHYDQDQYLNHPRLGALYARLSERVMSVSSILALNNVINGRVTIDVSHVKYALLVAINSIRHLESNLRINEAKDGETIESKINGIKEAILKRLKVNKNDKDEGWRYKSSLKDFLKRQKYYQEISKELLKHNQDALENSIVSLMGEGKIEVDGKKLRLTPKD